MSMNKKFFGTDGIRGRVGDYPINAEFVLKLGWAVGRVLIKTYNRDAKVLIGKDTRISGYMFESALEAGLSAAGVDILLLGPMPTPGVAYLTRTFRAEASIVISASHNPFDDNGIKFFSAEGMKLPDELEYAIEEELAKPMTTVDSSQLGKAMRVDDASGRYIEFCKNTLPYNTSLQGLKIVVDCANGATYNIAPNVYQELGADVIAIANRPDGLNINAACGSTAPNELQRAVKMHHADLGIALDGDGDRVILVDENGAVIDGDEILYVIANHYHARGIQLNGVVGTLMSNLGLELALKELAIDFHRSNVGDRYVQAELHKRDWRLGGEASGHIICRDATVTGDGIIASLQVLHALVSTKRKLSELCAGMKKFPQVIINVQMGTTANNFLENPKLQKAIAQAKNQLSERGRVLLRPSGTEPVVRVMVEGEDKTEVQALANSLASVVKEVSLESA